MHSKIKNCKFFVFIQFILRLQVLFFLIWCMCTFNSTLKYQSVLYKLTLEWMISYPSAIQVPNCSWIKNSFFPSVHGMFCSSLYLSECRHWKSFNFLGISKVQLATEIFKRSHCPWKKNSDELLSKLLNRAYINGCRHQRIN